MAEKDYVNVSLKSFYQEDDLTIRAFSRLTPVNRPVDIIVTELMTTLLDAMKSATVSSTIFLVGPPGTGKTVSLYWLFKQCEKIDDYYAVAIPLADLSKYKEKVYRVLRKCGNKKLILLIDLALPAGLSSEDCNELRFITPKYKCVLVAAASSLYQASSSILTYSFVDYYNQATIFQSKPFDDDQATRYLQQLSGMSSTTLPNIMEFTKKIPRLLNCYCADVEQFKDKALRTAESEYERVLRYMGEHKGIVQWNEELRLLLAAKDELPITNFSLTVRSVKTLFMWKSFMIVLGEDNVPKCYIDFDEAVLGTFIRQLWNYTPLSFRTNIESMIGNLFEDTIPKVILPDCNYRVKSLGADKTEKLVTLSFQAVPGTLLLVGTPELKLNWLFQTPSSYKGVDYVGLLKGLLLRSGDEQTQYLIVMQVTVQKDNQLSKMESMCTFITDLLGHGNAEVVFILVNPFWKDFDRNYDYASQATSGAARATEKLWYGEPVDYTPIFAHYTYLQTVFSSH